METEGTLREARWSYLQDNAKQPTIGKLVDEAMLAIERDNSSLKGVLPKDYAHPRLDKQRLRQRIDLIGNIGLGAGRAFPKWTTAPCASSCSQTVRLSTMPSSTETLESKLRMSSSGG